MNELGTYLRAARLEKGHSLRDAAVASGVSASTLSRAERGRGVVDTKILHKLANYCGVPFVDLVLMEDVPEMTEEEQNAFLVGHGYNLEQLRQEINALIDQLKAEARVILAERTKGA